MNSLHSHNSFISNRSLSCVSPQKVVSRSGKNSGRHLIATFTIMTSNQKNDSRVVTRCHGGRQTQCARDRPPPRQRNICGATGRARTVYVLRSHMRSQPHSDEPGTFREEPEQRRHWENVGTICVVAECHCTHTHTHTHTYTHTHTHGHTHTDIHTHIIYMILRISTDTFIYIA